MLVMSLYNVIDRIFIGQGVGPEAIAGLAITFPVMNISAALGVLIGAGASARVSIMLGAKDHKGAETVLGNSLMLILINATAYLTVFWFYLDDILKMFGASATSLPYARDFMLYILPGMLVMNIGFTLNNIMRASGYPVQAMISMFVGAGINLILAPLFIFVFDLGIKGAAMATDIAMTVFAARWSGISANGAPHCGSAVELSNSNGTSFSPSLASEPHHRWSISQVALSTSS